MAAFDRGIVPFWDRLSPEEQEAVERSLLIRTFEEGQIISSSDSSCMGMVFVLEGEIRVSLISEEGREITLYRVGKGDCCVTTASCVIRQITFDTVVSAGAPTRLLVIPAALFGRLSESNIYVRAFMFETETRRFSQAIRVIQQMLFRSFDRRLASYLISQYEERGSSDLETTQEEIARNVNSAREVVARMLRRFSDRGLVEVRRGHVLLRDPEGLRRLSE